MDIDDLRILSAVAKNGSMNRAAVELHMVQSNVTARVRQLEEELGVSLFVRHSRGVTLSDAGERLLSYSGQIDALFQEAIASVKENGVPKGALRIGSLEQTLSLRLPPVLEQYSTLYPAVALTITTGNTSDLIQEVLDQTLDGAFALGPVNHAGLKEEAIFRENLTLVTGLATRTMEELRQAKNLKALVRTEGCSYRKLLTGILKRRGINHQVLALASPDAIRSLVQSNVGVTLVPEKMLAESWKDAAIAVHELTEPAARVNMVFVTRTDRPSSSALEAFLSLSRASSNITA
jgi:LysR family transcriptional regulator, cell division regulator